MMFRSKDQYSAKHNSATKRFGSMLKEFIDDIFKDDIGLYAAQSTFYIVLSAIPSIMIIILCLKYFIDIDYNELVRSIYSTVPREVADFVTQILQEVFYRTETTAIFSAVFIVLLWSSSKGMMAIYCGLNKIYGYTKELSWWRMRVLSFFYNIVLFAVIIAAVVILVFGNAILSFFDQEYLFAHYIITVLMKFKYSIFFVILVLLFAVLFTYLPQRKGRYGVQLWGATITAMGWLLVSYGFSIYVKYFTSFSYLYGSIGTIILLMLWLLFCIYALLFGAEINKHIENGYFRRLGMRIARHRLKKGKKI